MAHKFYDDAEFNKGIRINKSGTEPTIDSTDDEISIGKTIDVAGHIRATNGKIQNSNSGNHIYEDDVKEMKDLYGESWKAFSINNLFEGNIGFLTLQEGYNLNNIIIPGTYTITSTAIAGAISNTPNQNAGLLIVKAVTNTGMGVFKEPSKSSWIYLVQKFIDITGNEFIRHCTGSNPQKFDTWTEWKQVPTRNEIDNIKSRLDILGFSGRYPIVSKNTNSNVGWVARLGQIIYGKIESSMITNSMFTTTNYLRRGLFSCELIASYRPSSDVSIYASNSSNNSGYNFRIPTNGKLTVGSDTYDCDIGEYTNAYYGTPAVGNTNGVFWYALDTKFNLENRMVTKVERQQPTGDNYYHIYFEAVSKPNSVKWDGTTYTIINYVSGTEYYFGYRGYNPPSVGDMLETT